MLFLQPVRALTLFLHNFLSKDPKWYREKWQDHKIEHRKHYRAYEITDAGRECYPPAPYFSEKTHVLKKNVNEGPERRALCKNNEHEEYQKYDDHWYEPPHFILPKESKKTADRPASYAHGSEESFHEYEQRLAKTTFSFKGCKSITRAVKSMKMARGLGIDLVDVSRFASFNRENRFLKNNFTPGEVAYCFSFRDHATHLAGTFAAKEAVFKALARANILLSKIEVRRDINGAPSVFLSNRRLRSVLVSISHTKEVAIAIAIRT